MPEAPDFGQSQKRGVNTTDVEGIVDILIQEDVIPMCDRDSILKAHIPIKEQVQKVLDVVWKKQHELTFISALKDTGNQHVADRILSSALPDDILEFQEQNNMDVINTDGNLATKETKETLNLKKENEILKEENSSLMESSRKLLEENRLLKDEVERLKCLQKAVRDKSNKTYEKQQKTHRENVELKKSLEGCKAINPEEVDQMKAAINELRDKDNHKDEILASQDLQQKRQALEIQSLTDFQALMDSDIKRLRDEVESQRNANAQMKNELESIKEAEDAKKNKLVDTETQTHAHFG
ncbi:hypothetical protein AM593_04141, partial [Mytilus galloprovincialis]